MNRPRPNRFAAIALALAVAPLVAGCTLGQLVEATPEGIEAWRERPLPPDPNLAEQLLDSDRGCQLGLQGMRLQILVQDRRLTTTAAFLVSNASILGICLLESEGGLSGSGDDPPGPMAGALIVDHASVFQMSSGDFVRMLAGRAAPEAADVVIELSSGESLVASLANGNWLGWWPQNADASRVVAYDADGAEVASLEVER